MTYGKSALEPVIGGARACVLARALAARQRACRWLDQTEDASPKRR
eukprot:COSAG02_NODE_838_length_16633_cov_15.133724_8_plen_46_part_00